MTTTNKNETYAQMVYRQIGEKIQEAGGFDAAAKTPVLSSIKKITTPTDIFELGMDFGSRQGPTWSNIAPSDLHPELAKLILEDPTYKRGAYSANTSWGSGNVRVALNPYRFNEGPVIVFQVGCTHDMNTTQLGNCYYKYTCSKCDYSYSIDSGD